MEYLLLIGGLVILIVAGEALVRGAVGIALKFRVSALVIGMTVVSFGTSAPELIVSLQAALGGHPEIAIGNVVGSNISNIALVLGITALILPIAVKRTTVKIDWPIMIMASIGFYLFALNAQLDWWEGLVFVVVLISFNVFLFWKSRKDNKTEEVSAEYVDEGKSLAVLKNVLFVLVGVIGLAFGASWLVKGAVQIAEGLGISEHIISVTIIAFGTSVPELTTSIMAAIKKETDISVGNLIGSNIFNLLGVLGITSLVKGIPISQQVLDKDIYWMLGISLLLFPLMLIGYKIDRIRGGILLASYCAYIFFVL